MPERNLEVVRSLMQAWEGVDLAAVDWNAPEVREAFRPLFTGDVRMRTLESGVASGVGAEYTGMNGLIRYLNEWFEPFSEYRLELGNFVEVGERVLVPSSQWGVGRGSGIRAELELTYLFELRDGLIARVEQYESLDEARRVAAAQ